ncbi:Os11g0672600, partial [Oryza sativa Japonica Group]
GSNALSSLHFKLQATASALRSWGAWRISDLRLQLAIAHEIILQLDRALDDRTLSVGERALRAALKGRCLALASLERIRLKQRSRLLYLKHSGTSAQFFRLKINARRRKKAIPTKINSKQRMTTSSTLWVRQIQEQWRSPYPRSGWPRIIFQTWKVISWKMR